MEVVVAVILLGGLLVIVNKSNRPSPGKGQKRPGHSSYRRRRLPPVTRPTCGSQNSRAWGGVPHHPPAIERSVKSYTLYRATPIQAASYFCPFSMA